MRRTSLSIAALLAVAAIVVSCTDRPLTAPVRPLAKSATYTAPPGCTATYASLVSLVDTVFGAGSPNANSALGKLSNMQKFLDKNDLVDAQAAAKNLISFIQQKASTLPGASQAQKLINQLECYTGLTANTFLIYPSDTTQTIVSGDGKSGLKLDSNPVSEPTLVTLTTLPDTGTPPLITKLDKYPSYVQITQQSGVTNAFTKPVTVAVCPASGTPDSIRTRLRLGHQSSVVGFEITPPADGSFLSCSGVASAASRLPGWVKSLASLVLPKPLYARQFAAGGVGGSASEFSPFGAVDPTLSFSGGVGGSASEFLRAPATTDTTAASGTKKPADPKKRTSQAKRASGSLITVLSTTDCYNAVVGTALPAECRPVVTLKTALGTVMQNVPVGWAIGQGGGLTAKDTLGTPDCLAFGATASTKTNSNGNARVCWTMGPVAGPNTVIATPTAGGDAPAGVTFSPATTTFTVTGTKNTATVTLSDTIQTFDGTPKGATVTAAPAYLVGEVSVTYDGSSTKPSAAGSYTAVATLVDSSWEGAATATFVIQKGAQSALTVTGAPATALAYGDSVQLGTSGGSTAGAVTFSAGTSTACSVNSSSGWLKATSGGGSCDVTATKAGDDNYGPVASASVSIAIGKANQSITFDALASKTYLDPDFTVSATASSHLTVSFVVGATDNCTISIATVTITGAGSCTVTASQAGDGNFNAATSVARAFSIAKANQTELIVTAPSEATYGGGTVTLSTTGGAGSGAVAYDASTTPSACSVNTASGVVTINSGTGTCTVTVTKPGDDNYNPATPVTKNITLKKASQSITNISVPSTNTYGDSPFTVSATASSGLTPVTFTVSGNCTVSGSTVTLTGSGSCTVTASQAGNDNYSAASGSLTFAIAQHSATATAGNATINFGAAVPTIPCTVTGLLTPDAGTVTCATMVDPFTVAGTYPTKPVVSPASPTNYSVTKVNGTLTVAGYVQVGCFSSPIYSVMPTTKSYQRKGSNIPVKCTLTTPQGTAVTTAHGNLLVQDMGTNGLATPTTAFSATNVFSVSNSGNYSYGLDTSPSTFISLHYYLVTATWNDGSTTKGWFYIK